MAVRSTNTMAEGLQGILQNLAQIKQTPDADLAWIIELETAILAKLKAPVDQMMGQVSGELAGMSGMPDPNNPGASIGMPGLQGAGGGAGGAVGGAGPVPAPGVAGVRQGPAMPNPDELRRMLQSAPVQGG